MRAAEAVEMLTHGVDRPGDRGVGDRGVIDAGYGDIVAAAERSRGSGLAVGHPTDPAEREADAIASSAARGPADQRCDACGDGVGASGPADRPGDGGLRRFGEARLGLDLADVRFHTGAAARASSHALGARAFTVGRDVVFRDGPPDLGTEDGRRLLLHELVHTAQPDADTVVRRQPAPDAGVPDIRDAGVPWPAGVPGVDPPAAGTAPATDPPAPPSAPPAPAFDPCAIDAAALSDDALLAMFARADTYVRDPDHYRRDQFWAYLTLRRRTGAERERRARDGKAWIADDITSVPSRLYRLEPGPRGGAIVVAVSGAEASRASQAPAGTSTVTATQLDAWLVAHHIARGSLRDILENPTTPHFVDVQTAEWLWQRNQPVPDPRMTSLFAPGLGGMAGTWGLGGRPMGPGAGLLDTLAWRRMGGAQGPGDATAVDWLGGRGWPRPAGRTPSHIEVLTGSSLASPSATLADRPGTTVMGSEGVFLPSPEQIAAFEAQGGIFLPENLPGALPVPGVDEVAARYPLPLGRVEDATRSASASLIPRSTDRMGVANRIAEQMTAPNRPAVTDIGPWALRSLRPGGTLDLVYRESVIAGEVEGLAPIRWTDPDTGRSYRLEIVSPVTQVMAGAAAPLSPGLGAISGASEPVFRVVLRKVPDLAPPRIGAATGWNAATGAAGNVVGSLTIMALERGYSAVSGQPYAGSLGDDVRNLAVTTPLAAGASAAEFGLQRYLTQRAAAGLIPSAAPGLVRFGAPAITAPLITMASLGLSSHSYPWQEYAVQGTRSGVNALVATGATVGFLAFVGGSAATGAEIGGGAGTVVEPGGGTVVGGAGGWLVGAVVGTVAYFISDHTIGHSVEQAARSLVGEPDGCH